MHRPCVARAEERTRELARQVELARIEAEEKETAKRQAAEREASRQRHGFASIIGQQDALRHFKAFAGLYTDAMAAPNNGRAPGHILLTGPDGTGRHTLGCAFAAEYGLPIVEADMRTLARTGDLMGTLTNLSEGTALMVTHLERTPRVLVEFLAPALTKFAVDFVVDKGMFPKTINVPLKRFTCIGIGHSEAQCPREVTEAFHLVIPMAMYSREELALICQRLAERGGFTLSPAASAMVARVCDGTPHHVKLLVSRLAASGKTAMDEEEVSHILSVLGLAAHTANSQGGTTALGRLSGTDFERLIAELLQRMGFRTQLTKASGDGGIDIVATLDRPIIGGRFLFQCKRFAPDNLVGSAAVREFYGALTAERGTAKGIFITTSDFTAQARDFADGLPVELVGGSQLLRLLSDQGLVPQADAGHEEPRLFDKPA